MNINNQRPIFVPAEHVAEVASISKCALMDMVWDLLSRHHPTEGAGPEIMADFRELRDIIVLHRRRARKAA